MKRRWRLGLVICWVVCVSLSGGHNLVYGQLWSQPIHIAQEQGVLGGPIESTLTVTPVSPNANDSVQVTISGIWSDGCIPDRVSASVADHAITVVVGFVLPEAVCGQVFTPWALTVDLGKLPPADYHIQVHGAVVLSTTVTVSGHVIYFPAVVG